MIAYCILLAAIALGVVGQVGLKFAATADARFWLFDRIFNEYFLGASAIYFVSMILYTMSLRSLPLSVAFPSVSISYVAVAWASHLIWNTSFGWRELTALALILAGIGILFSRSA